MSIWGWLKLTIAIWLFRQALRLTGWLIAAAIAVAAWPITVVAAVGYGAAWLRGWPPARLWRAAAWSLPMTAVYFTGQAHPPALLARRRPGPGERLGRMRGGCWPRARSCAPGLLVAPVAVPAGLALGGVWWAWRIYAITTGLAGHTASAPVWFDERQWRHQVRSARGRAAAPGTVPLLTGRGLVAVGRDHPGHRAPVAARPGRPGGFADPPFGDHRLVRVSGKTNLMMRLWAGWYAATHAAHPRRRGTGRC